MAKDFLESTQEVTVTSERDAALLRLGSTGRAILIVLVGGGRGERALLGEDRFVIGRGSDADLRLDSDAVSRSHAFIEKRGEHYYLLDNGSTNGSFVNYKRVQEQVLRDGDQIQIGQSMFKFLAGDNIETAYHEEFRRLVRRDGLTGALNRPTFDEELASELGVAKKKGSKLSLILFDLDHFKRVNDQHGHTAGDLVLSYVGEEVLQIAPLPHLFARIGGEEFAILVQLALPQALQLAEQVRLGIEGLKVEYEGISIPVTTSLGVVESGSNTPGELMEAADKNLYEAKSQGRNRSVG